MNINDFKNELERRLSIERNNLLEKLSLLSGLTDRFVVMGDFHQCYRKLINDIAAENEIDLGQPYKIEGNPFISDSNLTLENLILSETLGLFSNMGRELFEEVKRIN